MSQNRRTSAAELGVGNSPADPPDLPDLPDPPDPAELGHDPQLGASLPRAPRARMTVVQQTPSNEG